MICHSLIIVTVSCFLLPVSYRTRANEEERKKKERKEDRKKRRKKKKKKKDSKRIRERSRAKER
jgi:hypothetical protein